MNNHSIYRDRGLVKLSIKFWNSTLIKTLLLVLVTLSFTQCDEQSDHEVLEQEYPPDEPLDSVVYQGSIKYLALGDSYTIGQSVAVTEIPYSTRK